MKDFLQKANLGLTHREYRDLEGLSSSFISSFATDGVTIFKQKDPKKSKALSLGSAIDTYILNKDEFYKEYIVTLEKPSAQLGELYDYIKDVYYPTYEKIPSIEEVSNLSIELGLWSNIKDPIKRKDKLSSDFIAHLFNIPNLINKIPISEDDELFIKASAAYLERNLSEELFSDNKFRINHFQFVRDIPEFGICKAELDQLEVDFRNKIITITDIKTGEEPAHRFDSAFYKYKYWIQSGFYKHLIADLLAESMFNTFSINCKYIYISKNQIDNPVIWDLSSSWYHNAMYGWVSTSGYYNPGIYELVDEITWHTKNQLFEYPREVYENNKRFVLRTPEELNNFNSKNRILEV
jgi:hypothetical protein